VPAYYDEGHKKRYNYFYTVGSRMAQHSGDRVNAPWNWGYKNEAKAVTRKKMRIWIVHFTFDD
jgi:hypothetical protein